MIALEPEAASLFCTTKKLNETSSVSEGAEMSQPNTHYMIVDIGGKCIVHVSVATTVCVSKVVNYLTQEKARHATVARNLLTSLELVQSRHLLTERRIQAELRFRDSVTKSQSDMDRYRS